jgi:uncharacterized membrane protein YphA (DoxX/SURF4 family)
MSTQIAAHANRSPKTIVLWVLQFGAAAMFLMAGYGKLSGDPQMVGLFQAIGIGQWFRYLTGSIEVVSAILLLIPATAGLGATLLVGTMAGALATHLFLLGGNFAPAAVLFVVTATVAWARRHEVLRLLGIAPRE